MSERPEMNESMRPYVHEVSEAFGLSLDLTWKSARWAKKWQNKLVEFELEEVDEPGLLRTSRDVALQYCPTVPRDDNRRATFRAEFAAQEMLYRLMPDYANTYRSALEGEGLRVIPHFDRLDATIETLLEARINNEFPYGLDSANLPQDERNMPPELPRGGREHANFLWATCYYMRGGIKSTAAFAALSKIYREDPGLFDPIIAEREDPARISWLLNENGLAFNAMEIGEAWVENAHRMAELYDGDPRNLFQYAKRYEDVLFKVKNRGKGRGFIGFQEKMVSMITYYLMDAELIPYFDFPLPVDFHVLRVSAANEIITFENVPEDGDIYSDQTLSTLRAMYHDYSVTHGVSQLDVCNAVWSLSAAVCGSQPGNIMLEPGDRNNRDGRKTHIVPLPINVSDPTQLRMYERSCGLCPLEQTCAHNMPSKEYYVRGRAILSPRIRFESVDTGLFADNALRRMSRKMPSEQHFDNQPLAQEKVVRPVTDETLF